MKKFATKTLAAFFLLFALNSPASAQQDITEILKGSLSDAEKLGYAYLEPFGKMFGTSLNGGWYQAARPHKLLGFNVTLVASATMSPIDARTFDVAALGLQSLQLKNPQDNMAPTISGEAVDGPTLLLPEGVGEFNLPQGLALPLVPIPLLQAGIGLPFSSELTVRLLPSYDIGKYGRVQLWGVGFKNQFKDFIPGLKEIPIDLSLMVGYTNFSYELDIDASKEQMVYLNASGFTGRILVGKSIPLISVYAGLGYSQAITNMGLAGQYEIGVGDDMELKVDPLNFEYPITAFAANIGARVRLGIISVHADYTLGAYPLYSGGIGISFR
jgi:hypothetical protein